MAVSDVEEEADERVDERLQQRQDKGQPCEQVRRLVQRRRLVEDTALNNEWLSVSASKGSAASALLREPTVFNKPPAGSN